MSSSPLITCLRAAPNLIFPDTIVIEKEFLLRYPSVPRAPHKPLLFFLLFNAYMVLTLQSLAVLFSSLDVATFGPGSATHAKLLCTPQTILVRVGHTRNQSAPD